VFHVVLIAPEIPPNTGNVIRLCANTGCSLHLVEPLGFELSDAAVAARRGAGLPRDGLRHGACGLGPPAVRSSAMRGCLPLTTKGKRRHAGTVPGDTATHNFQPGDAFVFGSESRGLPAAVLDDIDSSRHLRLPLIPGNRSLNLSNAVAVTVYEAWRQQRFAGGG